MSNISLKQLIERNRVLQGAKRVASNTTNNIVNGFANFKQTASESLSELKKNNASRLVALMLAGATITSMSACDTIGAEKFEHGELYNNAMQEEVVSGVTFDDITPDNYYNYINEIEEQYPYGVAPYKFLSDKGVFDYDNNGNVEYEHSKSVQTYIMVDENVNNAVYVLVEYMHYPNSESDVGNTVCTWKLKYNLEEQDYKDLIFLSAKQDIKLLGFMNYIENKYDYEVESEKIVGSVFAIRSLNWIKIGDGFSSSSIHSLDTITGDVQFHNYKLHGNYMREAIYSTNIKDGQFWNYAIKDGFSEEYILQNCFPVVETEYGQGYTYNNLELDIFGIKAALHGQYFQGSSDSKFNSVPYEITNQYKVVLTNSNLQELMPNNENDYNKVMKELDKSYQEDREKADEKYYNNNELTQ